MNWTVNTQLVTIVTLNWHSQTKLRFIFFLFFFKLFNSITFIIVTCWNSLYTLLLENVDSCSLKILLDLKKKKNLKMTHNSVWEYQFNVTKVTNCVFSNFVDFLEKIAFMFTFAVSFFQKSIITYFLTYFIYLARFSVNCLIEAYLFCQ